MRYGVRVVSNAALSIPLIRWLPRAKNTCGLYRGYGPRKEDQICQAFLRDETSFFRPEIRRLKRLLFRKALILFKNSSFQLVWSPFQKCLRLLTGCPQTIDYALRLKPSIWTGFISAAFLNFLDCNGAGRVSSLVFHFSRELFFFLQYSEVALIIEMGRLSGVASTFHRS